MLLKDTLNLPKTDFPMRAGLTTREPARLVHWEKMGLYERIQKKNAQGTPFVLHDGPPFTNGDVHIGTALNKLLKDIVVRHKAMLGHRTPYVPGWDCHGLPIEHKVARELRDKGQSLAPAELRAECATFSRNFIEKQRSQVQRLGVLSDWAHEYKTMNPDYEAAELRAFAQFVERGLVYRSKKPVYWSIPCETALAEAEVEYKDHTYQAVFVTFPIVDVSEKTKLGLLPDATVYVVIWTTTPWTLPANLAIAINPSEQYQIVAFESGGKTTYFLLASKRVNDFFYPPNSKGRLISLNLPGNKYHPVKFFRGEELEGLVAHHPFINRSSRLVLADYVTMDTGTGCVHIAPGHGLEDYQTGIKYGLDIYCPIDDKGCYVDDGSIPAELLEKGITVLEKNNVCPANDAVIKLLESKNALVYEPERGKHQYPHCWRSKTPVVFRALYQWFIGLDKLFESASEGETTLRAMALESLGGVQWIPESGENRIRGSLESRPDWCVSRQRAWGVPIPVFYRPGGVVLPPNAKIIRFLADKIEKSGSNIWFEQFSKDPKDAGNTLLKEIQIPEEWGDRNNISFTPDTLDVWLDSGCSHQAVLKHNKDLTWPADLYLEGSDQHRGWFQSSLWTALATEGKPPYKAVLTHGFVVDENGRKLSKSDGKPQTADDYVKKFGADILRLWVASEDFQSDITVSDKIFEHTVNTYRNLRNTLMYQLGNLADFDAARDAVGPEHFTPLDKWVSHKLHSLITEVTTAFDAYNYHVGVKAIDHFVSVTLSRQYHDILKDRLYTFAPHWPARRAAQTAINEIVRALLRMLAPVLPFTADEAWSHLTAKTDFAGDSLHLQSWPKPNHAWASADFEKVAGDIDTLLKFRERVYEKLEALRQEKKIGKFLDAEVVLTGSEELMPLLRRYAGELPELFIVSQVHLKEGPGDVQIAVAPATGVRCPRSWRWVPELVSVEGFEEKVSPRDRDALLAKYASQQHTIKSPTL